MDDLDKLDDDIDRAFRIRRLMREARSPDAPIGATETAMMNDPRLKPLAEADPAEALAVIRRILDSTVFSERVE
jgi:hypothetical protein